MRVHICVCLFIKVYNMPGSRRAQIAYIDPQHRELISLLLQPHLQQALERPTTTSRPLRSALRSASSISSVMNERVERLKTPSWLSLDAELGSVFLWRRLSTAKLWFKLSESSSWGEVKGSSEASVGVKIIKYEGMGIQAKYVHYLHFIIAGDDMMEGARVGCHWIVAKCAWWVRCLNVHLVVYRHSSE